MELEEVRKKIIQYSDEKLLKIQLRIPQIHCSSCIYLLEKLHQLNKNILSSRVNFQEKSLSISVKIKDGILYDVFNLLNKLGYTPDISDSGRKIQKRDSKKLLIAIGVTGFCFGNIMLFSFPEYISGGNVEPAFQKLFSVLIVLLIIPTLYFGAKDYLKSAW